jgi:hypothetical protein
MWKRKCSNSLTKDIMAAAEGVVQGLTHGWLLRSLACYFQCDAADGWIAPEMSVANTSSIEGFF